MNSTAMIWLTQYASLINMHHNVDPREQYGMTFEDGRTVLWEQRQANVNTNTKETIYTLRARLMDEPHELIFKLSQADKGCRLDLMQVRVPGEDFGKILPLTTTLEPTVINILKEMLWPITLAFDSICNSN